MTQVRQTLKQAYLLLNHVTNVLLAKLCILQNQGAIFYRFHNVNCTLHVGIEAVLLEESLNQVDAGDEILCRENESRLSVRI